MSERIPYQIHLEEQGEKLPKILFDFKEGTIVYPDRGSRGVLCKTITAVAIKGRKIKGLTAYESRNKMDLYLGGKNWSLPAGSYFGAYSDKAKRRKIT